VAVDAELGILLRRAETVDGQLLSLTELTSPAVNPPAAADPARFTAPLSPLPEGGPTTAESHCGRYDDSRVTLRSLAEAFSHRDGPFRPAGTRITGRTSLPAFIKKS
jgi:hypothetical protein